MPWPHEVPGRGGLRLVLQRKDSDDALHQSMSHMSMLENCNSTSKR